MAGRGRLYIWFVAGLAVIVAGFWPSFFGAPGSNDVWHIVHGIAATLWVLLLIAQTVLIGRGDRRWHERLGWASLALFAAVFVTTYNMIRVELTGPEPFPAIVRQVLLFLDITFLALFAGLYAAGLACRRTPRLHVRLMGSTMLIGLAPALIRLLGNLIPSLGLPAQVIVTFATIEAILVIAMVAGVRRGRAVSPFPALIAIFAAIELGVFWSTGATFARMLRAIGTPV